MGSRMKEDGKSEKLIRSLLKQSENNKCINCSSRGPQYICTTFWTFVCTTCSGIHREFTHRVKSVSMAKFTPDEINSLKAGGNERAKQIYFKEVDLHRVPDNSNVDKLRDFIKHVYVDRRYTGEKITGRPSTVKVDNREEPYDNRRRDSYQGNQQSNLNGRSALGSNIISDWRREDRFSNVKRSDGDLIVSAKSSDRKKDDNGSSDPAIRPITDILGEDSISLRVIEPPRTSSNKRPDGSSPTMQITAALKSVASSNGNPSQIKTEDSLIDFDAECEPPVTVAVSQPSELTSADSSDSWDFLESAPHKTAAQNSNPLDSVLTQLSLPASTSGFPICTGASAEASSSAITLIPASMLPPNGEVKHDGRKELPADIFSAIHAPHPLHAPVWHTGLALGISYPVQYNTAVRVMPTFSQSTKSANPFDLGSGSSPAQAPEFPPMTPSWMPSQPHPSFGDHAMLSTNLPQRPQEVNNVFGYNVITPPNAPTNPFG